MEEDLILKAVIMTKRITVTIAITKIVKVISSNRTKKNVIIESCYDGDTCTTGEGEKIRLACIDTAELRGPKAQPVKA